MVQADKKNLEYAVLIDDSAGSLIHTPEQEKTIEEKAEAVAQWFLNERHQSNQGRN
jgi:hypothetical protein